MNITRRITTIASVGIALGVLVGSAHAQPIGAGPDGRWGLMGPGMMDQRTFGRMCSPYAAGFAEWQVNRLEQIIKPTEAQRPKFDEFKTASAKATETIRNACPAAYPANMLERMEVMEKRTEAMLQAIKTVRPALEAFYATLTDQQKAQLNSNTGPRRFWQWRESW